MPDAVMLFAAGLGTRMGSLTANCPKPLLEVSGRPLLDHALALADQADIPRKVVNTHYLSEQVEQHLVARPDVAVSNEQPTLLETGGGLRHALPLLGNAPVYTLNTDAVWAGANPLAALRDAWDPDRMDALLMLVARENAHGHGGSGDFELGADGRLRRGPGAIYTGAQILRTDGLDEIDQTAFSLNLLWNRMLERGRLFGILHEGTWCDVGRPEGIETAERMLAAQIDA